MNTLNQELEPYLQWINREILDFESSETIPSFYAPMEYVLTLPAKRVRPLLLMLVAHTLNVEPQEARFAAAAVELLHNFTLVHDDVMDNDHLRRGKPTVHEKWDVATAILAGDGLMGLAFKKLLRSPKGDLVEMTRAMADSMVVICEGQGKDKMFEQSQQWVTEQDYLDMIARKTAALLELSAQLGALLAGASQDVVSASRQLGYNLGMGFQIQDDLLDVMKDSATIGKDAGSDLAQKKQTILAIRLHAAQPQLSVFDLSLSQYRSLLQETGIIEQAQQEMEHYYSLVTRALEQLPDTPPHKILEALIAFIRQRNW